ncbi:hypothetical protein [Nostoc sp. T09]|uniref:hypothetical protein n=1 Tax=Nostoc sp. T09 TaxID=1932621 RepID=UPI0011802D72|nr:hypothetical protein [Nostoc sp. T09]
MRDCRETLSAVAHGGNHASSYNGGNLRNGLAPQDRAASPRNCPPQRTGSLTQWLPHPNSQS